MAYGDAEEVIRFTQVRPEDLGFDSLTEMKSWLEGRLVEITDLIETDRNRQFDPVPAGIHHIANQMGANLVMLVLSRRDSPIVRIDDYQVKINEPMIFTKDIRAALKKYNAKSKFRFLVPRQSKTEDSNGEGF